MRSSARARTTMFYTQKGLPGGLGAHPLPGFQARVHIHMGHMPAVNTCSGPRVGVVGTPQRLSRLRVRPLILAQVVLSGSWNRAPCQALCRQCGTCLGFSLSLPLSLSFCPSPAPPLFLK